MNVALTVAGGFLILLIELATAQSQSFGGVAFDVASVKTNRSGDSGMSLSRRGRTYTAINIPLRSLILQAYELQFEPFRLEGGPAWIQSERFDVIATVPENVMPDQTPAMLRTLLAERFNLRAHTETREMPIYALVSTQSETLGARLRRARTDCDALAAARGRGSVPPREPDGPPACGTESDSGVFRGGGVPLSALATMLSRVVQRHVIDRTGLSGTFDFVVRFSPAETAATADTAGKDLPSIFTALQEQLGLRLESTRGPVAFVVIDSVERPLEN